MNHKKELLRSLWVAGFTASEGVLNPEEDINRRGPGRSTIFDMT